MTMTKTTTTPTFADLAGALRPFQLVIDDVEPSRLVRLAPVLIRALAHHLSVDIVVIPDGPKGVNVLADEILTTMDFVVQPMGDMDDRLEVLDAVSNLVKKLDDRLYWELQQVPF